ncbi:hypothetical protein [uncultured Faecalibaculum sp.]|uniref:hypothetical protein n=1 Tax=uncultured Faecalibaculum sp. TaxID=1729681 RepID=UPI0025FFAF53|nr:hypothetical protein [uncultured Faecalibaculum sp.]
MADRFYGRLRQLERDSKNEMTILSDSRSSLDQLTEAMAGQELSLNDYLTLLRLTGQNYERYSMPPSAQKYVFMRMQSVLNLGKEKWKRRQYPLLTDTEVPLQPEIEAYLQQQRPLWRDLLLHYQRILVVTDLVLFLVILPLLVFVVKFSFLWSLIVSLLIWAGLAVYFQLFLSETMAQEYLASHSAKIGDSLRIFEQYFVSAGLPSRKKHRTENGENS